MNNPIEIAKRHNPVFITYHPDSPLSIGNGELVFTQDSTGFQSFDQPSPVPLCTMAQWGFHSYPSDKSRDEGYRNLRTTKYQSGNRQVGYMDSDQGQEELFRDLRISPHRANLVRIALVALDISTKSGKSGTATTATSDHDSNNSSNNSSNNKALESGIPYSFQAFPQALSSLKPEEITNLRQELDLTTGIITSHYNLFDHPVIVQGFCLPNQDSLRFRVESPLLSPGMYSQTASQALGILIAFPYPSHEIHGSDWSCNTKHTTELKSGKVKGQWIFHRTLDDFQFTLALTIPETAHIQVVDDHWFLVTFPEEIGTLGLDFLQPDQDVKPGSPSWEQDLKITQNHWQTFWQNSAWIDFAQCSDPRAKELERRIILSRYLTAIQCSGTLPPAETGLTCNSWYGKFHLEMHFWHSSSFPLWGQPELLERSMNYYRTIAPEAFNRARTQGYQGLRWPKMTEPQGLDSPSTIGVHLCWQQPHFLVLLDLLCHSYGLDSDKAKNLRQEYGDLVFATADWMADYPIPDQPGNQASTYHLGPPLIPVQENQPPAQVEDPVFELEYWRLGLMIASQWKQTLGQPIPETWIKVAQTLALPPIDQQTGGYSSHKNCSDTYQESAHDHPSFLMAWSFFAGQKIEPRVMEKSLDLVVQHWDFDSTWGWDFPVLAMTAARLGKPDLALDFLLMAADKNTWMPNGHNAQLPKEDLPLYLPGNGALLLAIAMMAGGWKGSTGELPGFPKNGSWNVQAGGIVPLPW